MSEATAAVEVSETCWCGTQVSVKGVTWDEASGYVTSWRVGHRHREVREAEHIGFASAGPAELRHPRWGNGELR